MGSWSVVFQCFFVSVGPRNGSPSTTNVILVVVIVVVGVVVVIIAYLGSAKAFSFHSSHPDSHVATTHRDGFSS